MNICLRRSSKFCAKCFVTVPQVRLANISAQKHPHVGRICMDQLWVKSLNLVALAVAAATTPTASTATDLMCSALSSC